MSDDPRDSHGRVVSPCVRVCCLDDEDLCLGCFRHIDEITHWSASDDAARLAILAETGKRRRRHQERYPVSRLQPGRRPG